eukprot:GEMP01005628.1.p1 GENE.GEMP01005628.1~~GEMP01005628.1.p1  ORF type:complete len:871 (+),score=123.16 GEMP01005628.1:308-2920(+)
MSAPGESGKSSSKGGESRTSSSRAGGLMEAVCNRDLEAAKTAVKHGANVNINDDKGWNPLRKASRLGDFPMVELLLENGADATAYGQIAIITAASWGRVDVLRLLLEAKANVGPDSEWEMSPLRVAAQHGHLRVIKLLLEFEADVNQRDHQNGDAITTAWDFNRSDIVLYLVEQGGNLRSAEEWLKLSTSGTTALMIAEGIARRNETRIARDEAAGVANFETYTSGVTVPMKAFCAMIEFAPNASLVLFDQVLFKVPKDAPMRAEMGGIKQNTSFLPVNKWIPKEEPRLLLLAPKDTGGAVAVSVKVFHQEKVLHHDVIFHLTLADETLFTSHAIQALLQHVWSSVAEYRFKFDAVVEGASMALLIAMALFAHKSQKDTAAYSLVATLVIFIALLLVMQDVFDEIRQLIYFRDEGRFGVYFHEFSKSTGASLWRWMRMLFGTGAVISLALSHYVKANHDDDNAWNLYHPFLTMYILIRWNSALTFCRGFEILICGFAHSLSFFDGRFYKVNTTHDGDDGDTAWETRNPIDNLLIQYRLAFLRSVKFYEEFAVSMWIKPEEAGDYAMCGNEWFGNGCNRDGSFVKSSGTQEKMDTSKYSIDYLTEYEGLTPRRSHWHNTYWNVDMEYDQKRCSATLTDFNSIKNNPNANSNIRHPVGTADYNEYHRKARIQPKRWFDYTAKMLPPENYNAMPNCIHGSYRLLEMFWCLLAILVFVLCFSNVFIAIIAESYEFEQEKAIINFHQERCHLCFRYLLAIHKTNLAPMEFILGKLLKVFPASTQSGYLWVAYLLSEDSALVSEQSATQGRLGYLKHNIQAYTNKVVQRSIDNIEDVEVRVGRDFDNSLAELKAFRKETLKILNDLRGSTRQDPEN